MINVSNEFREIMQTRRDFSPNIDIAFSDGRNLSGLGRVDFSISGNQVSDSAGAQSLPLGVAVSRSIRIDLKNDDDRYLDYNFVGARIRLYLTFQLSDTVEKIEFGTFTVVTPETYGATVTITAQDDMYKADKTYLPGVSFPINAGSLLADICSQCGIYLESTQFPNDTFSVPGAPDNITCRQLIGYIAMIAGGNARMSRLGGLRIIPYSFDFPAGNYHTMRQWKSLSTDFNAIVITGVQTTREVSVTGSDGSTSSETQTVLNGTDGYILSIENPLVDGKEEEFLAYLGGLLIGKSFWRFDGDTFAYPLAEFMDLIEFADRKGVPHRSVITDIEFKFFGVTRIKNSALPPLRNQSTYAPPENRAIISAKKLVQQEAKNRELAMKKLEETLGAGSGMYATDVPQPDGSAIRYLHDKPTLGESQNIIKITSDAIGISTDGGKTYPYGLTLDGETIMRIISVEGVQADWVKIENKTIVEYIQDNYADNSSVTAVTERIVALETDNEQIKLSVKETQDSADRNADRIATIGLNVDGISSQVSQQTSRQDALETQMTQIQQSANGLSVKVQGILDDGVDKVTTKEKHYTLDDNGLKISQPGKEIENRLDETGMYVLRGDTAMLQANNNGVIASDLTARNYLKIGHARFEAFGVGQTACFWMQFASGQNILLDSGRTITGSVQLAATYTPSSPLAEGDTYTVSLCVTPAAGVEQFAVCLSGGAAQVAVLPVQGTARQIIRATFVADYTPGKYPEDSAAYADVQIYRVPGGADVGDSTIHWCKVEIGDTPTDWSPAPED